MPIPSDNHAVGDTGHVTDHNNIADTLTALTAGIPAAVTVEAARAQAAEAAAQPKTTTMLVPAYSYPNPATFWNQLTANVPPVKYLIANVASGPGSTADPYYTAAIGAAQAAGVTILGYVDTNFGAVTLSTVQANIGLWQSLYGVTSIFFDRASASTGGLAYVTTACSYVPAGGKKVLNHGAIPAQGYAAIADILVVFEDVQANWATFLSSAPAWFTTVNPSQLAVLVYAASGAATMTQVMSQAQQLGVGSIYVTDQTGGNPFAVIPSYWAAEVTQARAPLSAYMPNLAQAAVLTANGTATANTVVPINTTSGNVTVTLPTAPPAGTIVAVKHIIQGGTSTVTVACAGTDVLNKTGGSTSMTLTLLNQGVLLQYNTGIWVNLADDLPLSGLDLRYAPLASPALTGTPTAPTQTAGDNTTKIATDAFVTGAIAAVKPAATDCVVYVSKNGSNTNDGRTWGSALLTIAAGFAALTPNGGTLNVGAGTFNESLLVPPSNLIMHGAGAGGAGGATAQTVIFASALSTLPSGDLISVPSSWYSVFIDGVVFKNGPWNGGGHIFNGSTSACSNIVFYNCVFNQISPGSCIWYTTDATLINCTWRNCTSTHTQNATVPSWWLISSSGGLESITWENIWHTYSGNYVIHIESTSASTYSAGHSIRNFTWEQCTGGMVRLLAVRYTTLENLIAYDNYGVWTSQARDGYVFGKGTGGNLSCWALDIRNIQCMASTLPTRTDTATCSTNSTTTVVNTAAAAGDVNCLITGAGIPAGATITAVTPGTGYTISAAATATAGGLTFTVSAPIGSVTVIPTQVYSAATCSTNSTTTVSDTKAVTADIGRPISGPGIPAGAVITAASAGVSYTISAAATATASGITLVVTTAVNVRFTGAARSKITFCSGVIDLAGQDVLTESMAVGVAGYTILNRSLTQSMDVSPINGSVLSPGFQATGISGVVAAGSRYVGATVSTAPGSGTWLTGDWVITQTGSVLICTTGGTPGTWAGAASLNTVLANTQPLGNAATVGASGLSADAAHVHPRPSSLYLPSDSGYLLANGDPKTVSLATAVVNGTIYLVRVPVPQAVTVTNVRIAVNSAGAGSSTGTFAALYNYSTGTQMAVSSDLGTIGTGAVSCPVGSTALSAGYVYVALLFNQATTLPKLYAFNNTPAILNTGLSAASFWFATNGTVQTTLPGSLTLSSNVNAGAGTAWLVELY